MAEISDVYGSVGAGDLSPSQPLHDHIADQRFNTLALRRRNGLELGIYLEVQEHLHGWDHGKTMPNVAQSRVHLCTGLAR